MINYYVVILIFMQAIKTCIYCLLNALQSVISLYLSNQDSTHRMTSIAYRSENFILVNKCFDILINSDARDQVTMQTHLRTLAPELVNPRLYHDFNFVHRLDYSTSGLLCIGVTKLASKFASKAFENRVTDKYYLAIVRGHVSQEFLEIKYSIGEDTSSNGIKMTIGGSPYCIKERSACTKVLILERGISHGYPASKLLLKPLTGRRHQLRVHLSEIGHTIVGDYTYSNKHDNSPYRMFLHAFRLVIPTPLESIDVQTLDPFLPCVGQNKWMPVEFINDLNAHAMDRLKHWQRLEGELS